MTRQYNYYHSYSNLVMLLQSLTRSKKKKSKHEQQSHLRPVRKWMTAKDTAKKVSGIVPDIATINKICCPCQSCARTPREPPSTPRQRAVIITVDASTTRKNFREQLAAFKTMAKQMSNMPIVLAATKRDIAKTESLRRLQQTAHELKIQMLEVSSKHGINVRDLFRVAAAITFREKTIAIPESVTTYSDGLCQALAKRARCIINLLDSVPLRSIEEIAEVAAVQELGRQAVTELKGLKFILTKNGDIEDEYGVKENPDLRIELLDRHLQQENFECNRGGILTW